MRPWKASTPPRITAISPGNRMPTKADASRAGTKNTTDSATQPCRDKMSSAARLIVVGRAVGLRSRAWPGSKAPGRHGNGNTKRPAARTMFPARLLHDSCGHHHPPTPQGLGMSRSRQQCPPDSITVHELLPARRGRVPGDPAVAVDGSDGGTGGACPAPGGAVWSAPASAAASALLVVAAVVALVGVVD